MTKRKRLSVRKGFSLVEMIVVVVIIGIISGGVMLASGDLTEKSRYRQAEKDLDSIVSAVGIAYESEGSFGSVNSGALDSAFNTSDFKDALERKLARPLDEISDPWGNEYRISSSYSSNEGTGYIRVYCADGSGSNVRKNKYNKDREMQRQIYNGGD